MKTLENTGFFENTVFPKTGGEIHFWGKIRCFWGFSAFLGKFLGTNYWQNQKGKGMRKKDYKGRCVKKAISKSKEICRTYDPIQEKYLDLVQEREDVTEIRCNVPIELPSLGSYTSDVVCITDCGEMFVRECVFRQRISKPMTIKLLDASREYWIRRGVKDWGIVTDEEK